MDWKLFMTTFVAIFVAELGWRKTLTLEQREIVVPAPDADGSAMWEELSRWASTVEVVDSGVSERGLHYIVFTHKVRVGTPGADSRGRHKH